MSRNRFSRRTEGGQVALEFALLAVVVVAISGLFFVFYQSFVGVNLHGNSYASTFGIKLPNNMEDKAFGLEMAVSLPFP
ncbi:MAG: hypothetical protein V1798_05220 [Pseudomonadota bacterium]